MKTPPVSVACVYSGVATPRSLFRYFVITYTVHIYIHMYLIFCQLVHSLLTVALNKCMFTFVISPRYASFSRQTDGRVSRGSLPESSLSLPLWWCPHSQGQNG